VQHPLKYLLYPLTLVYGLVIAIRNFLYNKKILPSTEYDIPVICVGNLAVGGTGKTSHTEYLITALKEHFRIAVLSRGYLRTSRGFRIVKGTDTVSAAGDEPLQIARKFSDITVAVDRDRNNGIKEILRQKPETELIIMDDGFQHRSVTPGRSIVLTEYSRMYISDHLLPFGRLREHRRNIERADFILVTKSPQSLSPIEMRIVATNMKKYPYQNIYFTTLRYGSPIPAFTGPELESFGPGSLKTKQIFLITGIANPAPLIEDLEGIAEKVNHFRFRDHHNFSPEDISGIMRRIEASGVSDYCIFTTEKDAVRLRMLDGLPKEFTEKTFYIPVEVEFLNDDGEEFKNHIINYVRTNKGNSRFSGNEGIHKS